MAKANPFRFSTKYQDDETDLLYYGYRYYGATTGRWLSKDPIGEEGGLNAYGAVQNELVGRLDVLGLMPKSEIIKIYMKRQKEVEKAHMRCPCPCADVAYKYAISGLLFSKHTVWAGTSWEDCGDYYACCGPYKTQYFWWDCYRGVAEGGLDRRGDFGWSEGDVNYFRTVTPSNWSPITTVVTSADPYHLAVHSIVIYDQCINGMAVTRITAASNALQFTWSSWHQAWTGPESTQLPE